MGKRGRAVILIAACGVTLLAALAWTLLHGPAFVPEPVYQGKPLSYWLRGYEGSYRGNNMPNQPTRADADAAILDAGTNAIPTLLRMLRANDSPLRRKIFAWAMNMRVFSHHEYAASLNMQAGQGLEKLGPLAGSAVPELIKILDQTNSSGSQCWAAIALGQLGQTCGETKAAVPSLLRAAVDTNDAVRNNALFALGPIGADPDAVVPVLIKALHDPWAPNRANAASSLAHFKGDAKAAVPTLVALLSDTNINSNSPSSSHPAGIQVNVQTQVEFALRQIDPETYRRVVTNAPPGPVR
jgi:HEAT repeat protein